MELEEEKKLDLRNKKDEEKENKARAFIKCKDECVCEGDTCKAAAFKQCTQCSSIMKSQYSKATCVLKAGGKPEMLTTKSSKKGKCRKKKSHSTPVYDRIYASTDDSSEDSSQSDSDIEQASNDFETSDEELLSELWKSLSPPTAELAIKMKWYAAIYTDDSGKDNLCIGRALKRFLDAPNGQITHLEIDCLKPRVGNDNILQEYPAECRDIYTFKVYDVIAGPLNLTPISKSKDWKAPDYDKVLDFFNIVQGVDREGLFAIM